MRQTNSAAVLGSRGHADGGGSGGAGVGFFSALGSDSPAAGSLYIEGRRQEMASSQQALSVPAAAAVSIGDPPSSSSSRPVHAIIADDSDSIRRFMVRLLRKRLPPGSTVVEAADGEAALSAAMASAANPAGISHWDLVILDKEMPGRVDGIGAARALREAGYRGLILGCTGSVAASASAASLTPTSVNAAGPVMDDSDSPSSLLDPAAVEFLSAGADRVLPKPAKIEEIVALLRERLQAQAQAQGRQQ